MNILLLTATIAPKAGTPNLMRADPTVRLADYTSALDFYISLIGHGVDKIIFAENSMYGLSTLRSLAEQRGVSDQIEFLEFKGLGYPPSFNRGYGEFMLIDHAMEHSQLIRMDRVNLDLRIWKVTGRYVVQNLQYLLARKPGVFDIYCNCRNFPKRLTDMYLMAWSTRGYQACLKGVYPDLKEPQSTGVVTEELLRPFIDAAPASIKVVPRFAHTPKLVGIRAGDNKGYTDENLWKYHVRATARFTCPWLWI